MSIPRKITEYLDAEGIPYEYRAHPPTFTAQKTAQVEHISGKNFAKTVMVVAGRRMIMAVVPASHHVDIERLRHMLGTEDARLATENEFAHLFPGCDLGAMPPLGNLYGRDVIADRTLKASPSITFNAGTHTDTISMKYADFSRVVRPRVGDFAEITH
ncbi:MAG: aminoacyl-tRNA deacylase [Candidatus Polarisedimenticolia bacterium]